MTTASTSSIVGARDTKPAGSIRSSTQHGAAPDAPLFGSREALRAIVREEIGTTFYPSSTCRMGPASDPCAMVDAHCRVHGAGSLRVVDASIFPHGPRCNLHWPIIAVAERAAALVRAG
ncbi:MAG TPA: GMC oxidoreductase [Thermomicrobiales bacterium]|nr:GMC oxidoreductase [Thermomicrobiales bacterium]